MGRVRGRRRLSTVLAALVVAAAACGPAEDATGGAVEVSGSSTVEPITARVAQAFTGERSDVDVSVEGPGTGDGFQRFCAGETDIADASRPISPQEVEDCSANGVDFVELRIAIDGISVITGTGNDPQVPDCLGFGDLYALVGPESEGVASWSDADPIAAEVADLAAGGMHHPYPDLSLTVVAPGEESGTYDSFVELVIEDLAEQRGEEPVTRKDYQASPNDNVIVQGIAGTPNSLGWVGFAFFEENAASLAAFDVDGGDGCVAATPETIATGEYPLSRPLFVYVNAERATEGTVLADFVDFYLSDAGIRSVADAGYVELTPDELARTRQRWQERTTGSSA